MEKEIKQKISSALEVASDIQDPTLKVAAFKVVLTHLLSVSDRGASVIRHDDQVKRGGTATAGDALSSKVASLKKSLPISDDDLSEVYEVDGDKLGLNIKIKGNKAADQQRKLAHAVLFGYKIMLDIREIVGSKILKVAKDWDMSTDHFVKNVGPSEYIQVRNTGKGKDPIYSLKPGALEKLCGEVKSLIDS